MNHEKEDKREPLFIKYINRIENALSQIEDKTRDLQVSFPEQKAKEDRQMGKLELKLSDIAERVERLNGMLGT